MKRDRKPETRKQKRILITRTDRLGDVVLSTAVIRYFRSRYPDAYLAFLVRPYTQDVVRNNPDVDEVIVYDKYDKHKSVLSTIRFAFMIRGKGFDTAIALHPTNRVHMMLFLAGIPDRIGYDRNLGMLLTQRVPHIKQKGDRHESEYNFDLLEKAGYDVSAYDRRPYIFSGESEKSAIEKLFNERGAGERVIAVHAGASCPSKTWQAERFAEACDILASRYGYDIVLIGGDETRGLSSKVLSNMKEKALDLTGVLSVGELAELLRRSHLLVSNDSGPVHIAVAVDTPVVCIFGRSDPGLSPRRWGPLGEHDSVLHKDVGCKVCYAHECVRGFECLRAVTVAEVVEAAGKLLNK